MTVNEKTKMIEARTAAVLPDPGAAAHANQSLNQAHATKVAVQNALWSAESQHVATQREVDAARGELNSARSWADNLRAERKAAEREAAASIEEALATALRNKSLFEQATGWVDKHVDAFLKGSGDFLLGVVRADWDAIGDRVRDWALDVVQELRTIIGQLQFVLAIVMLVVLIASFFVAVTVGPVLLTLALILAAAKLGTSVVLATVPDGTGKTATSVATKPSGSSRGMVSSCFSPWSVHVWEPGSLGRSSLTGCSDTRATRVSSISSIQSCTCRTLKASWD